MQLSEVFAADDAANPPTKPITFRVLNPKRTAKEPPSRPREISAAFVIVDEPESAAALRDAEGAIRAEYRDKDGLPIPIPDKARRSEEVYHFLFRALRDEIDPSKPLARTVLELRRAIHPVEAVRLMNAYNEWVDAEFPDTLTAAALKDLEEQATGK